jgi:hypothetical protein
MKMFRFSCMPDYQCTVDHCGILIDRMNENVCQFGFSFLFC